MQHFNSLEGVSLHNSWLTIGSFDGVHRGHQEILRQLTAGARASASPAVVLTFYPHPGVVLRGTSGPFYLSSPQERALLLDELGVDVVITHPFDRQLAAMSARDFGVKLKKHLGLRRLFVGIDFAVGHNREGDISVLRRLGKELNFDVQVIRPVVFEGQAISSSQIRALLVKGDVDGAARLLGRLYRITGEVVHSDGRGRTIGIPTANLAVWDEKLLPGVGVYACRARIGEMTYGAATNIGVRPTFDSSTASPQAEAHLLDYEGDLYGKTIQLEFVTRLRGEQRFPDIQSLLTQIHADIAQTCQILKASATQDATRTVRG
jgi:riboflavin kinase/FMN adenylyltransferase